MASNRVSDARMVVPSTKIQYATTNDVMLRIGYKNPWITFNLVVLGFVWSVLAMPFMIGAYCAKLCADDDAECMQKHPDSYGVAEEYGQTKVVADLFNSAFYLGGLFNVFVAQIADVHGRRRISFWGLFITGAFSIGVSFVHNFALLLIARFCLGVIWAAMFSISWVLASELIYFDAHPFLSAIFGLFWIIGYILIAYIAYLLPNWHHMYLVASIPCLVYSVVVYFFTPESLFYLVEQGKKAEVEQWIGKAEKYGEKLHVDVDFLIKNVKKIKEAKERQSTGIVGTFHFLKSYKMYVIYLGGLAFVWTTTLLVYTALSFSSSLLGNDPYWGLVFSGLVEIPANISAAFIIRAIGRKKTMLYALLMTGVVLLPLTFMSDLKTWYYLVLWLFGKSFISIVFIAIFVYGSEIFPTIIRSTCLGVVQSLSNIGGTVATQTQKLGPYATALYAAMAFMSAACMLMFPETSPEDEEEENVEVAP